MKLLLDQGLRRSAKGLLCAAGIDTLHTSDCGLGRAEDEEVLAAARREDRTVVTLDADFHSLLAQSRALSPSVVRIRVEGLRGPEAAALLQLVLKQCEEDLRAGSAVTLSEKSLRVRRLPLGQHLDAHKRPSK